jgi:hypothetical protein
MRRQAPTLKPRESRPLLTPFAHAVAVALNLRRPFRCHSDRNAHAPARRPGIFRPFTHRCDFFRGPGAHSFSKTAKPQQESDHECDNKGFPAAIDRYLANEGVLSFPSEREG